MSLLGTYASLFEADSEADWCRALFDLSKQFGFEQTIFAVIPRHGMAPDEAFLRSNHEYWWRTVYDDQGMVKFDPTVSYCLAEMTPLLWSPGGYASTSRKRMADEARRIEPRKGLTLPVTSLTLPIHGPRGEVGILCLVTDRAMSNSLSRNVNHHLPDIALLRDVAFETCQGYLAGYMNATLPRLTSKERECLKWTTIGKTSWEIANIAQCSEAVVNFHMSNIRRKMGLSSRHAAAVKAVQLGMISLD